MESTTITVRSGSICADATFQLSVWKGSLEAQVKEVLETWTRITGLNFAKMTQKVVEQEQDGVLWAVVTVEHPLDNRADVTFFWKK
jgi:hypothetical protein